MNTSKHIQEHLALGIKGGFGGNAVPIRSATELTDALSNYANRFVLKYTSTVVVTATAGNAVVTLAGETLRTNYRVRSGDLMRVNAGTRNYKVKTVTSDTTVTLFEPILAGDVVATVSATVTFYRIERITLILMPGEYTGRFRLHPGIDIIGTCLRSTLICESSALPYAPFYNFGDNVISNLTIGPTESFSSCDGGIISRDFIGALGQDLSWNNAEHWAGQVGIIEGCELNIVNVGGHHSGGTPALPYLPAGRVICKNTLINNDSYTFASNIAASYGVGTAIDNSYYTPANSFIDIINTDLRLHAGWETTGGPLSFGGYLVDSPATYSFHGGSVKAEYDVAVNPILFGVCGIIIQATVAPIVNVGGGFNINLTNTSGDAGNPTVGIDCTTLGTVNITHADIEVAGTGAIGVRTNDVSAVANIRHSRIKGSTNSLVNTAGTINAKQANGTDHGTVTVIGATSGVITATET